MFKEIDDVKLIITKSVEFNAVRDFVFPPSMLGFFLRKIINKINEIKKKETKRETLA